ncbi:phosphoglycerate dehydrogenase (plasmid) [Paroceanicella profunda]|uniref:Phosphoglycerate dehydrogenase n=1 Tax=Paroceanicella profunda TaxID=2579971 RepID=A0A5B8G092_9RHOB|nr:2-hydroxyacid dehydrogenase [Paroceanicella profunda]QDL94566.1 phosphoglycerate dehydrogenase [Paroceanicella profunda]
MNIVFHGNNALTFLPGFREHLGAGHDITHLPDVLETDVQRAAYAGADVIVGARLQAGLPVGPGLKLFHVPGAGYDGIDFACLPEATPVCNCFGHEAAIAEYVMAALLARHVPLADADARLRRGDWTYWAGGPSGLRTELGAQTIGILGYGHIGKAVAARAAAFGMTVVVANRSPVAAEAPVSAAMPLTDLPAFMAAADIIVNTLPLAESTRGLVGAEALAAMRPEGVIVNVGRGAVIAEQPLFEALQAGRIAGAILDTWYVYPSPENPNPHPATLPFHTLDNVVLSPHMSGWTHGTVARRAEAMAANVARLAEGAPLENRVR